MSRPPTLPPVTDAMWRSPSGVTVTPTQVVDALCAALSTLGRGGWQPGVYGVYEAIDDPDVQCITERCLDLVATYRTHGGCSTYTTWEQTYGRTLTEVQDLVTATITYLTTTSGGHAVNVSKRRSESPFAQYLTVGGDTVDITAYADERATQAMCRGCGRYSTVDWEPGEDARSVEHASRDWAQDHAATCRAMPRPGGA